MATTKVMAVCGGGGSGSTCRGYYSVGITAIVGAVKVTKTIRIAVGQQQLLVIWIRNFQLLNRTQNRSLRFYVHSTRSGAERPRPADCCSSR
eukprot:CAMPEP_0175039166 /NCGR_PEP_ID=MMETSP0052_2-20121109/375_1 /TAXON_ID=51329 ORGANISM="Polytomella parva, Strain SAG 63-3" /NCGR_SAMPLE_ID=MMETSP0052_2 /ASSEMBLY_ACC=CAM_ASM_000194 /LENGTH=91 /DNA_ID=CAMNT_0016300873 /DNA_START=11 /DNA_END=286 /DNA_ORIENTATION=-